MVSCMMMMTMVMMMMMMMMMKKMMTTTITTATHLNTPLLPDDTKTNLQSEPIPCTSHQTIKL